MTHHYLPPPATLARAVADTLVIASDTQAEHASIFYWAHGRRYALAVVEAMRNLPDMSVRKIAERLIHNPADADIYFDLIGQLAELYRSPSSMKLDTLSTAAWTAECNSRLGLHVGTHVKAAGICDVQAQGLQALPIGLPAPEGVGAQMLVVIPFRDRTANGSRLRNLLACLLSLRDQTATRENYRVLVVESDATPRWRDVLTPYTDRYLFAPNGGPFNKSWAVNTGVMDDGGAAECMCILDADVLVDRDFVTRNRARFERPGVMGYLPYRDMWNLDEDSTCRAIKQRLHCGTSEPNPEHLRAFVLRRPPGACVWLRLSAFHTVGGMDERFEGWGGEDNDFVYRLDTYSAFDSYNDPLLHMYHEPSAALRADGEVLNADIPRLSWKPGNVIGDIHRFAATL